MRWPAHEVMLAIEPYVDDALVGTSQLRLCQSVAQQLPVAVEAYYLECRLDGDPQVDLLVLTRLESGAAKQFEASVHRESLECPAGRRTLNLLRAWDASPELRGAELFWLEY